MKKGDILQFRYKRGTHGDKTRLIQVCSIDEHMLYGFDLELQEPRKFNIKFIYDISHPEVSFLTEQEAFGVVGYKSELLDVYNSTEHNKLYPLVPDDNHSFNFVLISLDKPKVSYVKHGNKQGSDISFRGRRLTIYSDKFAYSYKGGSFYVKLNTVEGFRELSEFIGLVLNE